MPNFFLFRWRVHFSIALVPILFYFTYLAQEPPAKHYTPLKILAGCDGSLGENLFEGGDFGSGTANIPVNDPKIAPGYIYANQGPPSDGLYVLTNNTGSWPGLYPTWIRIRDNSPDPNGYIMVVNASFEPGIFYQQEITGLCANTTFEFSADVINLISRNTLNHIKPNISFFINDELKFSSGDIPQDESWKTYGFTFTTGPTNTNLTLSIRNNAPGGIGNDLALDNISFRPCGPEAIILPEEETFVCVDEDSLRLTGEIINSNLAATYIQWQVSSDGGANYTDIPGATKDVFTVTNFASGTYFYRFLIASTPDNLQKIKCRVFSYPKEVIVLPKYFNIVDTICSGLVYESGNSSYTQTGIYLDTLVSSFGCDSIVTLNLKVIDDPMIDADITVKDPSCYGVNDAAISINVRVGGYPPLTYQLNDGPVSPTPSFEDLAPGTYRVKIEDKFGCSYEEQLSINYPQELMVAIGEDTMVELGTVYNFQSEVNYPEVSYQWNPASGLSCADCPQPSVVANKDGRYSLQVTNEAGCTATDSLFLSINTDESYQIYAPNVFSPNSDGINDRFTIFTNSLEAEAIEIFQIFDRWGSLLYESGNLQPGDMRQGWDGQYRNQPVDMGVYIYRVDVLFIDGTKKTFTGSVTIIR